LLIDVVLNSTGRKRNELKHERSLLKLSFFPQPIATVMSSHWISPTRAATLVLALALALPTARGLSPFFVAGPRASFSTARFAKPQRLNENAPGVLYVNDQCINCAACSNFAPSTFAGRAASHIVQKQPQTSEEVFHARQALAACPVAAIRLETQTELRARANKKRAGELPWTDQDQWLIDRMVAKGDGNEDQTTNAALFPRLFLDSVSDVYWLGHHNSKSFGAVPYLLRVPKEDMASWNGHEDTWIMVDSPKYSKSSVQAVTSLTGPSGPDYLFLTHVDDTADHGKWAHHFPTMQRIFHSGDLGKHNWLNDSSLETVEILLPTCTESSALTAYALNGTTLRNNWLYDDDTPSVVVLHTPGHSPGSISLYRRPRGTMPGILFTGDTYACTTNGNTMTGFPRYGNLLLQQATTLQQLLTLDWTLVAPGHGHPRDYRNDDFIMRAEEMQVAIDELRQRS
jgi:glyoxylase-like metal-dependent hydrolase (beta-lactamase superfamily II)/ferredoxin